MQMLRSHTLVGWALVLSAACGAGVEEKDGTALLAATKAEIPPPNCELSMKIVGGRLQGPRGDMLGAIGSLTLGERSEGDGGDGDYMWITAALDSDGGLIDPDRCNHR